MHTLLDSQDTDLGTVSASAFGEKSRLVEELAQRFAGEPAALLTLLVELNRLLGPLPPGAISFVAGRLQVPRPVVEALAAAHRLVRAEYEPRRLGLCVNGACAVRGGAEVERVLREKGVPFEELRCQGSCDLGPVACYHGGAPLAISAARARSLAKADPADWEDILSVEKPVHAFKTEPRVAFTNIFAKGSHQLPTARRHGVYRAVELAVKEGPEALRRAVAESGLAAAQSDGPLAAQWERVLKQGSASTLVVDGMESYPGTFKDRVLLERDPHLVVAGAILAAYAVGAHQAFVVIRAEYELATERMRAAVEDASRTGILGERVMGADFALQIRVRLAPSSYLAGERDWLLDALGGRAPGTARQGEGNGGAVLGPVVLVQNPETLATLPFLLTGGAGSYRGFGVGGAAGMKVVAISGDVARPGNYEVPRGTPLRELVELAGGPPPGKTLAALQVGGPAEPYLPLGRLELGLDDAALAAAGARVGSGAVLVLTDKSCLYDLARRETAFFAREVEAGEDRARLQELCARIDRLPIDPAVGKDIAELSEVLRRSDRDLVRRAMLPIESVLADFPDAVGDHAEGRCTCQPRRKVARPS